MTSLVGDQETVTVLTYLAVIIMGLSILYLWLKNRRS